MDRLSSISCGGASRCAKMWTMWSACACVTSWQAWPRQLGVTSQLPKSSRRPWSLSRTTMYVLHCIPQACPCWSLQRFFLGAVTSTWRALTFAQQSASTADLALFFLSFHALWKKRSWEHGICCSASHAASSAWYGLLRRTSGDFTVAWARR